MILMTTPFGSRTKKRRTPQGSSVSGYTTGTPRCTAAAWMASTSATWTVGDEPRRRIVAQDGELRRGVRWRRKRHDPTHVHHHREPEQTDIELPTLVEVLGL